MEGFMHWRIRPWAAPHDHAHAGHHPGHCHHRLAADAGITDLLVLSQVVLAMQLPFAMFPLLHFTSSRKCMGDHRNGWFLLDRRLDFVLCSSPLWTSTGCPMRAKRPGKSSSARPVEPKLTQSARRRASKRLVRARNPAFFAFALCVGLGPHTTSLTRSITRSGAFMKGDPQVIDALNRALTIELTAINQYFCQAKMCKNWGFKQARQEALRRIDGRDEARREADRPHPVSRRRAGDRPLRRDPRRHRRQGAVRERSQARNGRRQARTTRPSNCARKLKDNGTRELLEPILVESEEHVDWLETQLGLIEAVGLQNYLTEQMGGHDEHK